MLLETAIGDAYGAGLEYVSPRLVRENNNLKAYGQHPRHRIKPGCYTDDAQMSIAVAEALVDGVAWTRENLADYFVRAFKRDPREGYANSFYHFLKKIEDGAEFLAKIRPHSDKSGAAMRAAPMGVLDSPGKVIEYATVQSKLTHDMVDGINAGCAAALMSHYFLYGQGPKADLGRFLEGLVPGQWNVPWSGKVGGKGWMSTRAAITALMQHDRMSELLVACVNYGGDVDTVAAIALGPAACCDEIEQDLPDNLLNDLENGDYGRDYIRELDCGLLALVAA